MNSRSLGFVVVPAAGEMLSFFVPKEGILKQDYTDLIKEMIKKMGEEESNQR